MFPKGTATFTQGSKTVSSISMSAGDISAVARGSRLDLGTLSPPANVIEAVDRDIGANTITLRDNFNGTTGTYSFVITYTGDGFRDAAAAMRDSRESLVNFVDSADVNPNADTYAKRDGNGNVKTGEPIADDDATPYSSVKGSILSIETFAGLESLRPVRVGQAFTCQDRSNAKYILQPSGYTALSGDVTFANGRVGALQKTTDGWSAHHFGFSEASAATDNYAAITDAITRADGGAVVANGGFYNVSGEILMTKSGSALRSSDGKEVRIKRTTDGESVIKVSPPDPENGTLIGRILIENVRCIRSSSTANQVGFKFHGINGGIFNNIASQGSHTAVEMLGCRNLRGVNWLLFAGGGGLSYEPDTALIEFAGYPLASGGFSVAWTSSISNLTASTDFLSDYIFDIRAADGLQITNGYIASPKIAHFKFEPEENNSVAGNVLVSNIYMDGINKDSGSEGCVRMFDGPATSDFISQVSFVGCTFANSGGDTVTLSDNADLITFSSCFFSYGNGWGIKKGGGGGTVTISSCQFNILGQEVGGGGIRFVGGELALNGNTFVNIPNGEGVSTNSLNACSLVGNTFTSVPNEIADAFTTNYRAVANTSTASTLADI